MTPSPGMAIEVLPNRAELALQAARHWLAACRQALAGRGRFDCALAGGGTPRQLYHCLATPWAADRVDWSSIRLWQSDERVVPPKDPHSNWTMIRHELVDHVPVPSGNLFPMIPDARSVETPEATARQHEALLRSELNCGRQGIPIFDLILLGVGTDGHTASLFPGSPALEERERLVLVVEAPVHPPRRLTLTPPVIEAAREVVFLVAGEEKAEIVARILQDREDKLPAARLHPDGKVHWLLDAAAASRLTSAP